MYMNYMIAPGCQTYTTDKAYSIFIDVCKTFNVESPSYIYRNTQVQKREYVIIRQVSMVLFILKLNFTLIESAMYFNKKRHTTVLHAFRNVKNLIDTDRHFKEDTIELFKDVVIPESLKNIGRVGSWRHKSRKKYGEEKGRK